MKQLRPKKPSDQKWKDMSSYIIGVGSVVVVIFVVVGMVHFIMNKKKGTAKQREEL